MFAVAGCTFADFDGNAATGVYAGGAVSFVDCSFENNSLATGVLVAQSSISTTYKIPVSGFEDTEVRLEQCTFSGNSPSLSTLVTLTDTQATTKAIFYSESAAPPVCNIDIPSTTPVQCDEQSPLPLDQATRSFLTADSDWLMEVQQVCAVRSPCFPACGRHFYCLIDVLLGKKERPSCISPTPEGHYTRTLKNRRWVQNEVQRYVTAGSHECSQCQHNQRRPQSRPSGGCTGLLLNP